MGAEEKIVSFYDQSSTDKARLSLRKQGVNNESQKFHVPMMRLDSVLASVDTDEIKLIKVDVEGYEREVVEGLGGKLSSVQNIIFEVLPSSRNKAKRDVTNYLEKNGYEIYNIRGDKVGINDKCPEDNVWARLI